MEKINQRIEEDYLLGFIKYKEKYSIYLMPIAYWILNYSKYDPGYNINDWKYAFRSNILNVTDSEILNFIESIKEDKVTDEEFNFIKTKIFKGDVFVYFLADFDDKLFVNSFPDVEVETYLPNNSWKGVFDNAIKYIPSSVWDSVS